jgi:phosphoribosyl 1,2-cyclic phosphate phosphodiesterase
LKSLKKNFNIGKKKNPINIKSIAVKHGSIDSIAYIINKKVAYLSDANKIYDKNINDFKGLKYLIIDCLRFKEHVAHFNLRDILKIVLLLNPKKCILTNLHSDLDYNHLLKILPNNIIPGYDGLSLNI